MSVDPERNVGAAGGSAGATSSWTKLDFIGDAVIAAIVDAKVRADIHELIILAACRAKIDAVAAVDA